MTRVLLRLIALLVPATSRPRWREEWLAEIGEIARVRGKLAGLRLTAKGVEFALDGPSAKQVQLVGDFNGWSVENGAMKPTGTKWRRVLKLEPGRYRYRYVVDGEWLSDPLNANVEPNLPVRGRAQEEVRADDDVVRA